MKYELTLTIRPQWYQYSPQEQHRKCIDCLEPLLREYEVSLVAELTGEHNIHYHGLIELEDILAKDKLLRRFRSLNKLFGRKTCDQVKFEDSYKSYMRKDLEQTKLIIKDPIVRDSFGVFKTIF